MVVSLLSRVLSFSRLFIDPLLVYDPGTAHAVKAAEFVLGGLILSSLVGFEIGLQVGLARLIDRVLGKAPDPAGDGKVVSLRSDPMSAIDSTIGIRPVPAGSNRGAISSGGPQKVSQPATVLVAEGEDRLRCRENHLPYESRRIAQIGRAVTSSG